MMERASRVEDLDFTTGAQVRCRDGAAGTLRMVVADPHTRRITDLIVEKGHRQEQDRVLPVSIVERATDEDIYLSIDSRELTDYPRYREAEMAAPVTDWKGSRYRAENVRYRLSPYGSVTSESVLPMILYQVQEGIPSTVETLERGTPVYGEDGRLGTVDHILAEPESGEISHLVVRRRAAADCRVIPATVIENLREVGITVRASADELARIPRYQPRAEQDTLAELRDRFAVAPVTEVGETKVDLHHDVAQLTGVVQDPAAKRRAEGLARSVDGVIDVENSLQTDLAIAERVSIALRHDSRTHAEDIEVTSVLGVVTLTGQVRDAAIRDAAREIARQQGGVVAVTDELEIVDHRAGSTADRGDLRRTPHSASVEK